MPAVAQGSDVDASIHALLANPTVIGFVILNNEGIPVKYHEKMSYEKAVMYASLMSDFHLKARRALKELLPGPDSEMSNFRMRTSEGTELVGVSIGDFLLVVVQNCTGKPWHFPQEEGAAEASA